MYCRGMPPGSRPMTRVEQAALNQLYPVVSELRLLEGPRRARLCRGMVGTKPRKYLALYRVAGMEQKDAELAAGFATPASKKGVMDLPETHRNMEIARSGLLEAAEKRGVTADFLVASHLRVLEAEKPHMVGSGKDARIEMVPDFRTRLAALEAFYKLFGLNAPSKMEIKNLKLSANLSPEQTRVLRKET